jgi:hypothetical protein
MAGMYRESLSQQRTLSESLRSERQADVRSSFTPIKPRGLGLQLERIGAERDQEDQQPRNGSIFASYTDSLKIENDEESQKIVREFEKQREIPEMNETPSLDYFQGQDIDTSEDTTDQQAKRLVDSAEATFARPTGAEDITGLGTLMSFVSDAESYGGSLDAANRGTIGKKIIGSVKVAERGGKNLSDMTIAEIKEYQKITDPNNPNRLFAVGAFQLNPDTLKEAQKATGVPDDAVFNRETQSQLAEYVFTKKANMRALTSWLNDEEGSSLEKAMYGLAREFASMPLPYDVGSKKAGQSYYGSGNKAKNSISEVKKILRGIKMSRGNN